MSAFSPEVSDPARWPDRSFLDGEVERARAHVPAFDPDATPTSMHAIPEYFRRWPGTPRGPHPQVSVCALGPLADGIVAPHPFQDAGLLVLGVGFNRATLLHQAESLAPNRRDKVRHIPSGDGVERRWVEAQDVGDDLNTRFPAIGNAYSAEGRARVGKVGAADAVLASAGDLVPSASAYLAEALARPAR
jgi:aminoglycoside 3-N-acetyltransferase